MIAPTIKVNEPRWRPPWTTKDGKHKQGFWRCRVVRGSQAGYEPLTHYGAPRQNKTKADRLAPQDARARLLDCLRGNLVHAGLIRQSRQPTMHDVLHKYRDEVAAHRSKDWHEDSAYIIKLFCEGHEGSKRILAYEGWGSLPASKLTPEVVAYAPCVDDDGSQVKIACRDRGAIIQVYDVRGPFSSPTVPGTEGLFPPSLRPSRDR